MWDAYIDMEVGGEAKDLKMQRDAWRKVENDIAAIRDEIEGLVQSRLHFEGTG